MTNRDCRVLVAELGQVKHAYPLEEIKKPIKQKMCWAALMQATQSLFKDHCI